jgi:phosphoglycerol transferase MdoB-like AlkP superfamily enzyme
MPLCGSDIFRGVCDTAINTWLLNTMNRQPEKKEFYYWVTLNTHLPLVEIHDEGYRKFTEKWKPQGLTENILQLAYQQQLFFKDLAGKLSQPGMPKAHILLVGDHAPPFIDPADRALLHPQLVPYIELLPN